MGRVRYFGSVFPRNSVSEIGTDADRLQTVLRGAITDKASVVGAPGEPSTRIIECVSPVAANEQSNSLRRKTQDRREAVLAATVPDLPSAVQAPTV